MPVSRADIIYDALLFFVPDVLWIRRGWYWSWKKGQKCTWPLELLLALKAAMGFENKGAEPRPILSTMPGLKIRPALCRHNSLRKFRGRNSLHHSARHSKILMNPEKNTIESSLSWIIMSQFKRRCGFRWAFHMPYKRYLETNFLWNYVSFRVRCYTKFIK